ncbi:hypothetical protein RPC_1746 [Rhodopseudomonas palustris BisB18]|uniref:Transmembrane anti-sigma factor n=2 Tax=Rhodopseudomonas palustris TaxID=1076 RepID=Q217Y1_RHOPB
MAMSKNDQQQRPGAIEALLPWYAAGTLGARDTQRVERALASDPRLAAQFAAIQDECAATIRLDESLGAPSPRALEKLFAAIDAEPPAGALRRRPDRSSARLGEAFSQLSPRIVGWTALAGALGLLLQAGLIGALLASREPLRGHQLAAGQSAAAGSEPVISGPAAASRPRALVRFAPDARIAEIGRLLDAYQASIVASGPDGLLRLQFGDRPLRPAELDDLATRLQAEPIVSLAVALPGAAGGKKTADGLERLPGDPDQ